jgi:hypothetical protein
VRTARKLARDVVVRRAFEISAVAVIDKIPSKVLVSWLVCGSDGERTPNGLSSDYLRTFVRKYFRITEGMILSKVTSWCEELQGKFQENWLVMIKTDG